MMKVARTALIAALLMGAPGCQTKSQPEPVIRRITANPARLDAEAITRAREVAADHRRVLVYFHADWCGPCQRIGKAFDRPSNRQAFSQWVLLPVNVDEMPSDNGPTLGVSFETIPFFVKLDASGKAVGTMDGTAFGPEPSDEKVDEIFRNFLRT